MKKKFKKTAKIQNSNDENKFLVYISILYTNFVLDLF
jgi:hypothetical protein